jgi:hypothetical protein
MQTTDAPRMRFSEPSFPFDTSALRVPYFAPALYDTHHAHPHLWGKCYTCSFHKAEETNVIGHCVKWSVKGEEL